MALVLDQIARAPRALGADRSAATTATTGATERSTLAVVPGRRRAAGLFVITAFLVAALMLGAAVLHTQLAERQYELDRLARAVRTEQDRFDVLRRERAELRSPNYLGSQARALGMGPAAESEFKAVDAWYVAMAIAATGVVPQADLDLTITEPLEQFRRVKAVVGEAP